MIFVSKVVCRRFRQQTYEDPVARCRESCSARADGERGVLGGQQPGNGQQTDGEEEVEEEEHDDRRDACLRAAIRHRARENSHADGLAGSREQHELAATESVDNPDGYERGQEIGNAVEAREQERQVVLDADGSLHDDGRVVGDQVDAGDLEACEQTF